VQQHPLFSHTSLTRDAGGEMKSSLVGLEVMAVGALVLLVDGCKDGRTKAGAAADGGAGAALRAACDWALV
jgi:hypothetical protein